MYGQELQERRSALSQRRQGEGRPVLDVEGKNAYVCEEHYKQFKKGNKKSDQIEKWRHPL